MPICGIAEQATLLARDFQWLDTLEEKYTKTFHIYYDAKIRSLKHALE